jgi:hypothetical protein
MAHGKACCTTALIACAFFSGAALAQSASGSGAGSAAGSTAGQGTGMTTGPAAGTDVAPSTVIQKEYEHRSTSDSKTEEAPAGDPHCRRRAGHRRGAGNPIRPCGEIVPLGRPAVTSRPSGPEM